MFYTVDNSSTLVFCTFLRRVINWVERDINNGWPLSFSSFCTTDQSAWSFSLCLRMSVDLASWLLWSKRYLFSLADVRFLTWDWVDKRVYIAYNMRVNTYYHHNGLLPFLSLSFVPVAVTVRILQYSSHIHLKLLSLVFRSRGHPEFVSPSQSFSRNYNNKYRHGNERSHPLWITFLHYKWLLPNNKVESLISCIGIQHNHSHTHTISPTCVACTKVTVLTLKLQHIL